MEVLATAITEEKEVNKIKIGKEVKLLLFADDMILYTEDHKATRKLLSSMNLVVIGCQVTTQKSVAFLYTNNEKSETEIQEAIPFTTASKRIKYLGINLPKMTKDLYSENHKMLMKEIKEDINRWKDISYS